MNTQPPRIERVPLTEAEIEHLAPIIERWEAVQKEAATAQRDVDAIIKLYRAQHKAELSDGPEWQLSRDCFLRPRIDSEPPASPNGQVGEDAFAEIMQT